MAVQYKQEIGHYFFVIVWDCLGYPRSSVLPNEFQDFFFYLYEGWKRHFDWDNIESVQCF